MQQIPLTRRDRPQSGPPKGHSCRSCKRYGCVLPYYRGRTSQPV